MVDYNAESVLHLRCLGDKMLPTMTRKKRKEDEQTPKDEPKEVRAASNMVRLPPDLHRQLKRLADANRRPLAWELRGIIEAALREAGFWPPPD